MSQQIGENRITVTLQTLEAELVSFTRIVRSQLLNVLVIDQCCLALLPS